MTSLPASFGEHLSLRDFSGDESIFLEGARLRVTVVAAESFVRAEASAVEGSAAIAAPVLRLAGSQSAMIDLGRLVADGEFELRLRTAAGEAVRLGAAVARSALHLRQGKAATEARVRIAHSAFARGERAGHALLYADPGTRSLRLRLSTVDDIDAFLAGSGPQGVREAQRPTFSVVAVLEGDDATLDGFLASLRAATTDLRGRIEVVLVETDQRDRSPKALRRWEQKNANVIRVVRADGVGRGEALNAGIAAAKHSWVALPNAADMVAPDYFRQVDEALDRARDPSIAIVACRSVEWDPATRNERDADPLRFRFLRGERAVPVAALGADIQVTARDALWRRDTIAAHDIAFDGQAGTDAVGEALFASRYLLAAADDRLLFAPSARYLRRRTAVAINVPQDAWLPLETFDESLRSGPLAILREAAARGPVAEHIQNAALYLLSAGLRTAIDQPAHVPPLNPAQRETYLGLLRDIFAFIDPETVGRFGVTLAPMHRVGILGMFKNADPDTRAATVSLIDSGRHLVRVVFWSPHAEQAAAFLVDDVPVQPAFAKVRTVALMGTPFVHEHIAWVGVESGTLRVRIEDRSVPIDVGGRRFIDGASLAAIVAALAPEPPAKSTLPPHVIAARERAATPQARAAFRQCWLFIDRDNEADDSAEYLYRYVRERAPWINAFFILQRGSPQWARLEADRFRLIGFHEPEHATALLNASHLISSQADHYVAGYLGRAMFGDMLKFRFTFLNHGIIKDDISGWLNHAGIDCFVTSTRDEWHDIARDGSPYIYSAREVILSGMPRHDALWRASRRDGRTIVIMPTWRAWLSGVATGAGNARSAHPAFYQSEFAVRWKALLHSPRLAQLADEHGYRIVFVPHPNIEQYIDFFELPDMIAHRSFGGAEPIQDLFGEMSLLVTDFSSKAFDAAFLLKPVIYYQFDADAFFGGGHASRPGYFDYERDGFGPVCRDANSVLDAVARVLSGAGLDPAYREREAAVFPFRDGRASERVFNAILAMDVPWSRTAAARERGP